MAVVHTVEEAVEITNKKINFHKSNNNCLLHYSIFCRKFDKNSHARNGKNTLEYPKNMAHIMKKVCRDEKICFGRKKIMIMYRT